MYEKLTFSIVSVPSQEDRISFLESDDSAGSSITANTLSAEATAFWSSVTTPEISLKGFVYWLEYDRKLESCPTVITPKNFTEPIALSAPAVPTPRLFFQAKDVECKGMEHFGQGGQYIGGHRGFFVYHCLFDDRSL